MTPKVRITAHYDMHGCHTIEAHINSDAVTRADVANIINALFHPRAAVNSPTNIHAHTHLNRELGETEPIPRVVETVTAVTGTRQQFAH